MLEQDLAGEEDAIKRYKMRVEQAEQLKEYALAQQLRTILATEQEHAMDLQQALGK
jgi:bacterioferritin